MTITGGPVFWILLALVASSAFVWLERLVDLRRAQINVQDFLKGVINVLDSGNDEEALAICEDEPAPVAAVVATAIRHANGSARLLRDAVDSEGRAAAGRLDRRLAVLAIVAQIAPLLGLFGTVVGFIKVVMRVSGADLASRADLVGGARLRRAGARGGDRGDGDVRLAPRQARPHRRGARGRGEPDRRLPRDA